ncbi:MAG: hypothetical protein JWM96_79 [Alphaproteobacteria bacterium]|nr:hypothetical protein [Alphaproteobacteria bacterium]
MKFSDIQTGIKAGEKYQVKHIANCDECQYADLLKFFDEAIRKSRLWTSIKEVIVDKETINYKQQTGTPVSITWDDTGTSALTVNIKKELYKAEGFKNNLPKDFEATDKGSMISGMLKSRDEITKFVAGL